MSEQVAAFFAFIALLIFFFFQAEDGIRDGRVTGVQTCALPISLITPPQQFAFSATQRVGARFTAIFDLQITGDYLAPLFDDNTFANRPYRLDGMRSEERRVGKECRSLCLQEYFKRSIEVCRDTV